MSIPPHLFPVVFTTKTASTYDLEINPSKGKIKAYAAKPSDDSVEIIAKVKTILEEGGGKREVDMGEKTLWIKVKDLTSQVNKTEYDTITQREQSVISRSQNVFRIIVQKHDSDMEAFLDEPSTVVEKEISDEEMSAFLSEPMVETKEAAPSKPKIAPPLTLSAALSSIQRILPTFKWDVRNTTLLYEAKAQLSSLQKQLKQQNKHHREKIEQAKAHAREYAKKSEDKKLEIAAREIVEATHQIANNDRMLLCIDFLLASIAPHLKK